MREREVFESMRMEVRLAPGEMLVLAGLPDSGCRPGHYFHTTESAAGREQKIVLIRPGPGAAERHVRRIGQEIMCCEQFIVM